MGKWTKHTTRDAQNARYTEMGVAQNAGMHIPLWHWLALPLTLLPKPNSLKKTARAKLKGELITLPCKNSVTSQKAMLKHATGFWLKESNRKWAVFLFNLSSHYHVYNVEYFFTRRDDWVENVGKTNVIVSKMFTSVFRLLIKHVAYLSSLIWQPILEISVFPTTLHHL